MLKEFLLTIVINCIVEICIDLQTVNFIFIIVILHNSTDYYLISYILFIYLIDRKTSNFTWNKTEVYNSHLPFVTLTWGDGNVCKPANISDFQSDILLFLSKANVKQKNVGYSNKIFFSPLKAGMSPIVSLASINPLQKV